VFPLRPGETQFQVAFHLPYDGQARIDPRSTLRGDAAQNHAVRTRWW
jgi:hypothetical protein